MWLVIPVTNHLLSGVILQECPSALTLEAICSIEKNENLGGVRITSHQPLHHLAAVPSEVLSPETPSQEQRRSPWQSWPGFNVAIGRPVADEHYKLCLKAFWMEGESEVVVSKHVFVPLQQLHKMFLVVHSPPRWKAS